MWASKSHPYIETLAFFGPQSRVAVTSACVFARTLVAFEIFDLALALALASICFAFDFSASNALDFAARLRCSIRLPVVGLMNPCKLLLHPHVYVSVKMAQHLKQKRVEQFRQTILWHSAYCVPWDFKFCLDTGA